MAFAVDLDQLAAVPEAAADTEEPARPGGDSPKPDDRPGEPDPPIRPGTRDDDDPPDSGRPAGDWA